jgi:hypothetical protein
MGMRGDIYPHHDREMRAAGALFRDPTDPAAARLVHRLCDDYEIGTDSWKNLGAGVLAELRRSHDAGVAAAVWIIKRMLASFRWELSFWTKETGVAAPGPTMSILEQFTALPFEGRPNPYSTAGGFHPYIHLIPALELVATQPVLEVFEPLEELLEFWLAYTEVFEFDIIPRHITLLESLVKCYRVTRDAGGVRRDPPEFLVNLSNRRVSHRVIFIRGPEVLRIAASFFRRYSLTALAKRTLR